MVLLKGYAEKKFKGSKKTKTSARNSWRARTQEERRDEVESEI